MSLLIIDELTTALLDRLGHHAHIITTKGVSPGVSPRRRRHDAPLIGTRGAPEEAGGDLRA